MPKERKKRLSTTEKLFVKTLVENPGMTQTDAMLAVRPEMSRTVANSTAYQTLQKPRVQQHINDVIAAKYPDFAEYAFEKLKSFIDDPEVRVADKLKALEMIAGYQGWKAPTERRNLNLKADLSKYKLPGGE